MADCKMLRCEIERQKKKTTSIDLYLNGGDTVKDDVRLSISEEILGECACGKINLSVRNEELSECVNLAAEKPVCIYLPMTELPRNITALYMFSSWWTRPAFARSPADIPDRTQVALFRYGDRFGCFVPMVGRGSLQDLPDGRHGYRAPAGRYSPAWRTERDPRAAVFVCRS